MATSNFIEYNLPKQSYAAFDAISMSQLMIDRLKTGGIFTDANYDGSNISAIKDILAYTFHVLMFYLNNTSSEVSFNQVELYENMNKIVSLIQYKPRGRQTAIVDYTVNATSSLPANFYNIKRFAYLDISGTPYSFSKDITFQKNTTSEENINSISDTVLLYQGKFKEYPIYTAIGEDFEQFTLAIDLIDDKFIDDNNVFIFVYDSQLNVWNEWLESSTLFLSSPNQKVFEKRLNEYGRYEIKFGNNINGKKLNAGDLVAVYYLESDGNKGVIGSKALSRGILTLYSSELFTSISNDIYTNNINYLMPDQVQFLSFDNENASTTPTNYETVTQIRQNAPGTFAAQNRAVTISDYSVFIQRFFANIISSFSVVSNNDYISEYLKYFYNIGLERPNDDERVLFNQVQFNTSCDFNNVYIFTVPKINTINKETTPSTLSIAQKQLIIDKLSPFKMINHNIIISDPIYQAFDVGFSLPGEQPTLSIKDETKLHVQLVSNSMLSKEQVKNLVYTYIVDFFNTEKCSLNQLVDLNQLSLSLFGIEGIKSINTVRTIDDKTYSVPKISFIYWNPLYPKTDVNISAQNIQLPFYKFPFLYEKSKFINKIIVT